MMLAQKQGLVLGMNVDEVIAQLSQHFVVHRRVVHERTGLSLRSDFTTDNHLVVVIQIVFLEPCLQMVIPDFVSGLDHAFPPFVPDDRGVHPLAERQSHGSQQNGLARPGLSRNDREPGLQRYPCLLNQGIIGYI